MPGSRERSRNNFQLGLFVLVTIVLGFAIIFSLADVSRFTTSERTYIALFDVEDGVGALKRGSSVRVGGIRMGHVDRVRYIADDAAADGGDANAVIRVTFSLDDRVTLYEYPTIRVSSPLIGSESWLDIMALGRTEPAEDGTPPRPLDANTPIAAAAGGSQLDELLGADTSTIIADLERFTAFLGTIDTKYDEEIRPILANARSGTGRFDELGARVLEDYDGWSEDVTATLDWTESARTNVDDLLAGGQGFVDDGRAVIRENRESIRRTVKQTEKAVEEFRELGKESRGLVRKADETLLPEMEAFLQRGSDAIESAKSVLRGIERDYPQWSTDVSEALVNARQATQQFRIASTEIRRSPWKIIYRPSDEEYEHELLYEAARSFAFAASDLRAASLATERMLRTYESTLSSDPALLQRIKDNLIDPLEQYESAQNRLFDAIQRTP